MLSEVEEVVAHGGGVQRDAEGADEAVAGDFARDFVEAGAGGGAAFPGVVERAGWGGELGGGEEAETVHGGWV